MSAGSASIEVDAGARWPARPAWARTIHVAVAVIPVLAGIGAATLTSRILEHPQPGTAPWWLVVLAVATAASALVAAAARRLLPLAALLQLSLVFPDHTPSRFGMALRAGSVSRLRRDVAQVRAHGMQRDAGAAAESILGLATALNVHDARTRGHSERVRALAELIAEEMHLPPADRDRLRWAALLHDCGKLMVHTDVLNKQGQLSDAEWTEVRRHPIEGARLAAPLEAWLGPWALAIEEHHERWDGSGYPHGRAGADISLGARIVAVADSFEVMTSARSYQRAVAPDAARAELAREAGRQFDPDVVRAFLRVSIGRLRWLVGPIGWLADLPVIRTAARAPTVALPVTLTAFTLAVAGVLGGVTPPGRGRAAGAPQVVASAPSPGHAVASATSTVPPVTVDLTPTDVLGTRFVAPTRAQAGGTSAPTPAVAVIPGDGLGPDLLVPAVPADVCVENGPLSGLVDTGVEPVVGAVMAPLGVAVDGVNCGAVVPVEGLLGGLLGPMAGSVGNLSLRP
ncbi:MAG: hypothetical protein QOE35_2407 [Actinomycetota bacterium]|jgi:putative nucleotidyltransferase with HDIG domain